MLGVFPPQAIKLLDSIYKDPRNLPKDHPVEFIKYFFDSILWSKQIEVVNAVKDYQRTAVRSANTVGKSNVAAKIALWFLLSYQPSKVIITAPTFTQIEEILWKEIATLYNHSKIPIGGELLKTELKFDTDWFALGISTNEVNRFQGFHSPYLLVIIDEALGVDPMIWEAIEGLHPYRILAIGNPLSSEGEFFKCFSNPSWHKIGISALDCVRWQQQYGNIPGLVTLEWCEERAAEWGIKSPLYVSRVLGEFPQEGTDTLIHLDWVDKARTIEPNDDEDSIRTLACDIATKHGENKTVLTERSGNTVYKMKGYDKTSATLAAFEIKSRYNSFNAHNIVIDSDGFGEGVADIILSQRIGVLEFHGGYGVKAIDSVRYKNPRTMFYYILAKKFEKGMISLKKLEQKEFEILKNQLCSIKKKSPDAQGRQQIETKDDMLARTLPSPDYADSAMMSEFGIYSGVMGDMQPIKWR